MSDILIGLGFLIALPVTAYLQSKILTPEEQRDFVKGMDEFLYGDL